MATTTALAVGPGQVWIVARVDIDDGLRGAQVKSLVRGIESGLKHEAEEIYRRLGSEAAGDAGVVDEHVRLARLGPLSSAS